MTYKVDQLTLMSGADVKIDKPLVRIHQPKIKEIALIGEGEFFRSLNIFHMEATALSSFLDSMEDIKEEEKAAILKSTTSYDNLLFVMQASSIDEKEEDAFGIIRLTKMILNLIMPDYQFSFNKETSTMLLSAINESNSIVVDRDFFMAIKEVAGQIFLLDRFFQNTKEEKKLSKAAQKIADKIAASERKIRKSKGEDDDGSSQFALIMSIMGVNKSMEELNNLTIYQLYNQFERYNLFTSYGHSVSASLAGASSVEFVDWYKKL